MSWTFVDWKTREVSDHNTCFHKCYKKNKRSSGGGSQNIEHSGTKIKSSTGTAAPVKCVFCGEKEKDFSNKCQKCRNSLKNYTQRGEYHTSFHSPNVQHFQSLTE